MQIILACVETDYVPMGTWRHDLGERPQMREVKRPHRVMWLLDGSEADMKKAQAYVDACASGWRVYSYRADDEEAWDRVLADVMRDER